MYDYKINIVKILRRLSIAGWLLHLDNRCSQLIQFCAEFDAWFKETDWMLPGKGMAVSIAMPQDRAKQRAYLKSLN